MVTASCTFTAVSNSLSWIVVNTVSAHSVSYSVAPNTDTVARTGSIAINGVAFPITQAGAACGVSVSPAGAMVPAAGGAGNFLLTGQAGCRWEIATAADWVTFSITSGEGSATVIYNAAANDTGTARTANIVAGNQTFTLQQAALSPSFTAAGVLSAASFQGGAVAPGMIITIFGSAMASSALTVAQVDLQARAFPAQLDGTQVLFDGQPAPLLYVSAGQLSAVVPFAVAGRAVTRVEIVRSGGARSAAVSMPVGPAAPGLFTRSAQGSGPAAIVNQDFTINEPANPATPGSIVSVFATGGGVLDPPGADGRISQVLSSIAGPVEVLVDGRAAEVFYAGGAPELIHGVVQLNVKIPADARPGELPIVVRLGTGGAAVSSQNAVTVSVK